jgi:hypothetical protein
MHIICYIISKQYQRKLRGLLVGVWKHVRRRWGVFSRFIRFEVGDGSHISFWHDVWCGDHSLKDTFPGLFHIAQRKEARVMDNLQVSNGVMHWNVPFLRVVQDWEVEVVLASFGMLYSLKWRQGGEDCIWWIPSKRRGAVIFS